MTGTLRIHLKANERIFINGGVIKVDRKVSLDLLNDMVFLLESHVLQQEDATTPLRQLYFIVQSMLMDPKTMPLARQVYDQTHGLLIAKYRDLDILQGLVEVRSLIDAGRAFEALKQIRAMFVLESEQSGNSPRAETLGKAVA